MFNKPKAKTPVASPETTALTDAPRRQPSRIGVDLQVRGSVVGDGWLQLEGQIKGDVHVGRLFVEETGAVEGAVSAEAAGQLIDDFDSLFVLFLAAPGQAQLAVLGRHQGTKRKSAENRGTASVTVFGKVRAEIGARVLPLGDLRQMRGRYRKAIFSK